MGQDRKPGTVVFDLDGTLFETAPDLIAAVNHTLALAGGEPVAVEEMRPVVSFGGREMIRAGLKQNAMNADDAAVDELFPEFVAYYSRNIAVHTRPFPGLLAELDRLADSGRKLAVCTNKLEGLTWPLLSALGLDKRFAAVTGRDTFPVCKPDPRHLLGTIAKAGGDPTNAVMIGDSNTDVKTAKAAGIPVVGVTFGYTDIPITELGCDGVISHYDELAGTLDAIFPA
jgi:phosphoglycolate phosphatase